MLLISLVNHRLADPCSIINSFSCQWVFLLADSFEIAQRNHNHNHNHIRLNGGEEERPKIETRTDQEDQDRILNIPYHSGVSKRGVMISQDSGCAVQKPTSWICFPSSFIPPSLTNTNTTKTQLFKLMTRLFFHLL